MDLQLTPQRTIQIVGDTNNMPPLVLNLFKETITTNQDGTLNRTTNYNESIFDNDDDTLYIHAIANLVNGYADISIRFTDISLAIAPLTN